MMMPSSPFADALTRVERRLFEAPVLEALIARREAGEDSVEDAGNADALARELVAHQTAGGSWGDSLALTAEALLLLSELRPFEHDVDESVGHALDWIRSRQRMPGAFGDGCDAGRHAIGLCHHFLTGFFSPGLPTVSFEGSALSNGAHFTSDEDARLGLSALGLRAVLNYQPPRVDDLMQIDGLRRIADMLFRGEAGVSTPAAVTVLGGLAAAPRTAVQLAALHGALSRMAGLQRADGSWPGAEPFHVADLFLLATQTGFGSPLFDRALSRTAELLMVSQQPDGSWGQDAGPYRMLIGWRTLRYAVGMRSNKAQTK